MPTDTVEQQKTDDRTAKIAPRAKLPRGVRKHIRRKKADIRHTIEDREEAKKRIEELYAHFSRA